jgi:hypothetical protein
MLPAVDVNRFAFIAGAVAVAYLITHRMPGKASRRRG